MPRTFQIVLLLAAVAACKTDKSASKKPDEAKLVEPGKARDPGRAEVAAPRMTPDPSKPADPATDDPAKPDESSDDPAATGSNTELQNKGLAMMTRMSDLFTTHGKDCDKLAVEIRSMVASNKELLAQLRAADLKQTGAQRTAFEARNRALQEAALAKMAPVAKACRDNAAFMAAMRDTPSQ